jgi:hypothetical protein
MTQRSNEGKSDFFQTINKINKLLAKLTKRRKQKTQINKIRMKGGYYNRHQRNSDHHMEIF